jgi:hypothetical protein
MLRWLKTVVVEKAHVMRQAGPGRRCAVLVFGESGDIRTGSQQGTPG